MKKKIFTVAVIILSILIFGCPQTPSNQAPKVTLSKSSEIIENGAEAVFTAEATDEDGDTLVYTWHVNEEARDAETGTTLIFSASPQNETIYTVRVTVSDGLEESYAEATITVKGKPRILYFMYYDDTDSDWKALDIAAPPAETKHIISLPLLTKLLAWTDNNDLLVYTEATKTWDETGMSPPGNSAEVVRDLDTDRIIIRDDAFIIYYSEITYSSGVWNLEDPVPFGAEPGPSTIIEICSASGGVLARLSDKDTIWFVTGDSWVDSGIVLPEGTIEMPELSTSGIEINGFTPSPPNLRLDTGEIYVGDGSGNLLPTGFFCPEKSIQTLAFNSLLLVLCED